MKKAIFFVALCLLVFISSNTNAKIASAAVANCIRLEYWSTCGEFIGGSGNPECDKYIIWVDAECPW